MKKLFVLGLLLTLLFAVIYLYSAPKKYITKLWTTDESSLGLWNFKWIDEWGGKNYQCIPYTWASQCNVWSWKAEYELLITQSDPCPQNNSVTYGETLSRNEAANQGETVPESTVFTFSLTEIIE